MQAGLSIIMLLQDREKADGNFREYVVGVETLDVGIMLLDVSSQLILMTGHLPRQSLLYRIADSG